MSLFPPELSQSWIAGLGMSVIKLSHIQVCHFSMQICGLSGEFKIPAGVPVALMIYSMHHNPKIYPNPEVYNPERFLPENAIDRHPYAFIPFSAGPGNYIGNRIYNYRERKWNSRCSTSSTIWKQLRHSSSRSLVHNVKYFNPRKSDELLTP